jgi:hypothetical protein
MIPTVPVSATKEGLDRIARLRVLESKIESHLEAISLGFYEIGLAFKTIRDEELYKEQYLSFQSFCEANNSKYRICYQVIRQYVTASEVIDILQDSGFNGKKLPQNASLCRPLAKLKKVKEKMARVWSLALADTDDSPTASVVNRLVLSAIKPAENYQYQEGDVVKITDVPGKNGSWAIVTVVGTEHITVVDYAGQESIRISDKSCYPIDYTQEQLDFYQVLLARMEIIYNSPNADSFVQKTLKPFSKIMRGSLSTSEEIILKTLEELCK